MNKMLVAVFENEIKAYEGLSALKSLHKNADISLYASAVISKDAKGNLHFKDSADEGPIGTATGLLAGGLIGLLGGPVGVAIGVSAGTAIGLMFDMDQSDINSAFIEEVSDALANGKTAVIAEIDESWTVPVDSKLEPLGAVVFRRLKFEVIDEQLERESKAIAAEYEELKNEFKQAREEDKAKINAAIARLEKKAQATNELLKKKLEETKRKTDAKINAIEKQMEDAQAKQKAKLKIQMDTIKEEYEARASKLKQASKLINEAFSLKKEAAFEIA